MGAQGIFKPASAHTKTVATRKFRVKDAGKAPRVVFTARIVRGDDGYYVAYCEEIPGCVSQGKTVEEAQENFLEALSACLETLAEMANSGKSKPITGPSVKVSRFALTPVPP